MSWLHRLILSSLLLPSASMAAVTVLPGSTPQVTMARAPFPNPIRVRVTDGDGAPVAGASVQYYDPAYLTTASISNTRGCEYDSPFGYSCMATTGSDGVAVFPALAGRWTGSTTATIGAWKDDLVSLGKVFVELQVEPAQTPAALRLTVGEDQRVPIGTTLSPLEVRLTNAAGAPLPAKDLYLFPYVSNTGNRGGFATLAAGVNSVKTDGNGIVRLPSFRAGWGIGPQSAKVWYLDESAAAHVELTIRYTATNEAGQETLELHDLWWGGPSENGWGVSISQHGDRLFNVFFVYDDQGNPTWFVQPGGQWEEGLGSTLLGTLYTTRGTPWYAYDSTSLTVRAEGRGSTQFSGPKSARIDVGYQPTTLSHTWKQIVRQDFRRTSSLVRNVSDMWWGGPEQNGWGVAIHEQEGNLFIVWFTYDAQGKPTWFVMPDGTWSDSGEFSGAIYRTRGSRWFGLSYDPGALATTTVGQFRLRFDEARQRGDLDFTLEGRSGTLRLVRQPF